ncbi:MAG: hypothetical protein RR627_04225 [Niameybacter sp.]
MKRYEYKAYGLNIISEMELPELMKQPEPSTNYDVQITYGELPTSVQEGREMNGIRCYEEGLSWFYASSIATYCMIQGKEIRIKEDIGAKPERVRAFLLGRALGMLMFQLGTIVMHGAVVDIDGKGIIITGKSGMGKSSLLNALVKEGHPFLTDDVVAISKGENHYRVEPAYAIRKLCYDTMERFGYNIEDVNVRDQRKDKCTLLEVNRFKEIASPLTAMYEIVAEDVEEVSIRKLKGMDKMDAFLRNGYWMHSVYKNIGLPREILKQMIQIVKSIEVYTITRPQNQFTVEDQMQGMYRTLEDVQQEMIS